MQIQFPADPSVQLILSLNNTIVNGLNMYTVLTIQQIFINFISAFNMLNPFKI